MLEEEGHALARGARVYAGIPGHALGTVPTRSPLNDALSALLARLPMQGVSHVVAAGDGDHFIREAESQAMEQERLDAAARSYPKRFLGNLYAAAAAVQVGLAATVAQKAGRGARVLANCFGYGSEQGSFLLEGA